MPLAMKKGLNLVFSFHIYNSIGGCRPFLNDRLLYAIPNRAMLGRLKLDFLKKWANPRRLFRFIFGLFKQTLLQFLQQIKWEKCPSSIRCRDSNSQPSDYESPPLTTRPGLPPQN